MAMQAGNCALNFHTSCTYMIFWLPALCSHLFEWQEAKFRANHQTLCPLAWMLNMTEFQWVTFLNSTGGRTFVCAWSLFCVLILRADYLMHLVFVRFIELAYTKRSVQKKKMHTINMGLSQGFLPLDVLILYAVKEGKKTWEWQQGQTA